MLLRLLRQPSSGRARGARGRARAIGRSRARPEARFSASWARLIGKAYPVDPLRCRKCGAKLKIVAYIHDTVAIKQILDYLGLSPPEEPKPPPVVRVSVDEEGWGFEAP